MKYGFKLNPHALWIGVHDSPHNKRYCINLLPFLTVWVCEPGGKTP